MEGSDGKFEMVKTLIQLTASDSEDVAAIACFDLGEFVRHYPNGRDIARRLGARDFVFPLIEHKNPKLQRQALTCISKLLVQNWKVSRYINRDKAEYVPLTPAPLPLGSCRH
jgi:V-type H+-transporting ATPase subunit H